MDSAIFSPSDDIISEILSRTCIQTLGRCRLVSKQWNQTTYTSNFLDQFLKRTNTVSGFFIQDTKNNNYTSSFVPVEKPCLETNLSLDFLPYPVKILAADNKQGILLCESRSRNHKIPQYYVCKPATKQWRTMPNPKTRYFTKATAIMVLRSEPAMRFKIVRFSERKSAHIMYKSEIYYNVRCEIFDSETWVWKEMEKDIRLPYGVYLSGTSNPSVVSACGKLYWLVPDNQIFVFDLHDESWKIFSLPKSLCDKENSHQLVEYEGRLGLVSIGKDEDCLELWVMKEYEKIKVWSKRLEIDHMEDLHEQQPHACPIAFCNADVAILKGYFKMIFYNFQNHKNSKDIRLDEPFLYARDVFSLQSDFEAANFCWK